MEGSVPNSNVASRTSLHSDGGVVCPPISSPSMGDMSSRKRGSGISKGTFSKKEQLRCMVCGGRDCARCGLNAYKQLPHPAIRLMHSAWITDYIIGMQRPNDQVLDAGALQDMVDKKITAVFNLTEPGEHPYCGTGILADSGFPYSPEKLMAAGSKFRNVEILLYLSYLNNSKTFQLFVERYDSSTNANDDGHSEYRLQ